MQAGCALSVSRRSSRIVINRACCCYLQGLMASDWGGQPIQPFMSPDALADKTCGGTVPPAPPGTATARNASSSSSAAAAAAAAAVASSSQTVGELLGGDERSGSAASVLWWGMTEPLAQMRLNGAVWYQGAGLETTFTGAFTRAFTRAFHYFGRSRLITDYSHPQVKRITDIRTHTVVYSRR
jgi:hypothetical protein